MNNALRCSIEIGRRNSMYYELRRIAKREAEIRKSPEALKALKERALQFVKTEPDVVIMKNGEFQKAKLSQLSKDTFEKSGRYNPGIVVSYSNDPKFPVK